MNAGIHEFRNGQLDSGIREMAYGSTKFTGVGSARAMTAVNYSGFIILEKSVELRKSAQALELLTYVL